MQKFFESTGRIDRLNHFYIWLSVIVALAILNNLIVSNINSILGGLLVLIIDITGFWIYICAIIKRFHDLDKSGKNFWFLLIPLYNIYIYFCLFFKKGTTGANLYGDVPVLENQKDIV